MQNAYLARLRKPYAGLARSHRDLSISQRVKGLRKDLKGKKPLPTSRPDKIAIIRLHGTMMVEMRIVRPSRPMERIEEA
ncbi:hypothetical protein KY290_024978 [Solanum tuberosum]|uniref:Uncharacterized protein n=1 Tax=Solanum tuberosum TaxID=4113 RepID=A0ABQ7UTE2_SOLTU|nr:hypothetical protein KY290_024978 [Solanum tuberosum]